MWFLEEKKEWGDEREKYTEGKSGDEDEGVRCIEGEEMEIKQEDQDWQDTRLSMWVYMKKNGEWQIVRYIILRIFLDNLWSWIDEKNISKMEKKLEDVFWFCMILCRKGFRGRLKHNWTRYRYRNIQIKGQHVKNYRNKIRSKVTGENNAKLLQTNINIMTT